MFENSFLYSPQCLRRNFHSFSKKAYFIQRFEFHAQCTYAYKFETTTVTQTLYVSSGGRGSYASYVYVGGFHLFIVRQTVTK